MKAITLLNLFGRESIDFNYNGVEDEFYYNGKYYLPLETVKKWYRYREEWIEEVNNED